jgi:hypothetical protein
VLGYVLQAGQSVAVAGVAGVAEIAEIVVAVEVRHRRNIFDEAAEEERTLPWVLALACRCLVGIEVLGLDHFGIRLAGCTAVVGMWTAGSQIVALERPARSNLGLPRILI